MSELESESFDPQRRRLCPDGDCVGVIGPDGRCRICGTVDDQAAPAGLGADAFAGGCAAEDDEDPGFVGAPAAAGAKGRRDVEAAIEAERGDFNPDRVLCLDGNCIGVIGADDRCSECGRPSGPAAAVE